MFFNRTSPHAPPPLPPPPQHGWPFRPRRPQFPGIHPIPGPDGPIYWSQNGATNAGFPPQPLPQPQFGGVPYGPGTAARSDLFGLPPAPFPPSPPPSGPGIHPRHRAAGPPIYW